MKRDAPRLYFPRGPHFRRGPRTLRDVPGDAGTGAGGREGGGYFSCATVSDSVTLAPMIGVIAFANSSGV